jgi:hypothetical protein
VTLFPYSGHSNLGEIATLDFFHDTFGSNLYMEPRQQEDSRNAANQAFIESLNQLEEMLSFSQPASTPKAKASSDMNQNVSEELNLAALEDAAADIEAFMQRVDG